VSRIIGPFFRLAALALLLALVLRPEWFEPILKPFTENNAPVIYNQGSLLSLTLYHLGLVAVASLIGAALALVMGVFVTRKVGEEFLPLSRSLVNIGQTFPPVAVLALALPVILAGIRLSVVINMGTATIGSTVAAKGLGEVIIAGLLTSNTSFILQGGIIVALLAVLIYDALSIIERRVAKRTGRLAEVAG
jgi:osmoprotectant transport system permease protein